MGAISRGLEINWDKKQFLPPSNLNYDWSLKLFSVVCCNGRQKQTQIKNSFNTFPAQMTNKTVIIFSNSKAAWLCMVKH